MLNFLFWNINRKPIAPLIAKLARERSVDVLVLAECEINPMTLLAELNRNGRSNFFFSPDYAEKFLVYTRFEPSWLLPLADYDSLSIRHLVHPLYADLIVGIVHLRSKLYLSDDDQSDLAIRFREPIERVENELGHSRTVLFGNFNMNPFERGMAGSESFHAVMDRATAEEKSRIVSGSLRQFFYNSMWSLMGDLSEGPSGTYYYRSSEPVSYFWHMVDQVILRPSLMPCFNSESLTVIAEIGNESLLRDNGRPDTDMASDHLPIFFRLELSLED